MSEEERIRETVVLLERAREDERVGRLQAEQIIAALMRFTERGPLAQLHLTIAEAFAEVLHAAAAIFIEFDTDGRGSVLAATQPHLLASTWHRDGTFQRTLARGKPTACFDAAAIPQWQQQPAALTAGTGSLLLLPLTSEDFSALLVLTAGTRAFFDGDHIALGRRLIPPAAQALAHARSEAAERHLREAVEQQREQLRAEIAGRVRLEEELRAAREAVLLRELKEKADLIEHQRAAIRSLENPIIELWPGVLCLPVVGFLDESRSQHMTTSVLQAVERKKARVVIVDITGTDQMDAGGTGHLIRIAAAVRLLGAKCAITGVSATVACKLIALNIDVSGLLTYRRVRDALAHLLDLPEH
jgi:rsbT co-antagonist protein RsbR